MSKASEPEQVLYDPEPRWPAFCAILAVGGLYTALPEWLIVGPRWMFIVIVIILLIPTVVSHWIDYRRLNRFFGFVVSGVVTVAMVLSVIFLIGALFGQHKETPAELLTSAASLWTTNILVFTLWYWRLDAGG